jgi:predicted ATPase
VADAKSVDDAVAAALHLPTSSGRSSTAAIVDYLRNKTMLLVLDNCEYLVEACSRLVQTGVWGAIVGKFTALLT